MDTQKHKPEIKTWRQLKETIKRENDHKSPAQPYLGTEFIDRIKKTGLDGDPDWLFDLLTEVKNIEFNNPFYILEFHRTLKDYKLDIEGIYNTYIKYAIEPNS